MPRTQTLLVLAVAAAAATGCHDDPVRPAPAAERTITHTVQGKPARLVYDGRTATLSVDGRARIRVRYDGELRHVTAVFADGRTFQRTYTRRELAAAARRAPRPSLDLSDGVTDGSLDGGDGSGGCTKEWITYAGAALITVVTCEAVGPTPPCAAAVAATAAALEDVVKCETKNATPVI